MNVYYSSTGNSLWNEHGLSFMLIYLVIDDGYILDLMSFCVDNIVYFDQRTTL